MRRVGGLFLFAILAGFCIGLGGTVFLRLRDAFPGGNVVGALLFTIGLFTICTRARPATCLKTPGRGTCWTC